MAEFQQPSLEVRLDAVPLGALVRLRCGCTVRRGHAWTLVGLVRIVFEQRDPACDQPVETHTVRAKGCPVTVLDEAPRPELVATPGDGDRCSACGGPRLACECCTSPQRLPASEPAPASDDGQRSLFD